MTKFIIHVMNRICLPLYNADVLIIIIMIIITLLPAGKSIYACNTHCKRDYQMI